MFISKKKFESIVDRRVSTEVEKIHEYDRLERLESTIYKVDGDNRREIEMLEERMIKRIEALEDKVGIEREQKCGCPLVVKRSSF